MTNAKHVYKADVGWRCTCPDYDTTDPDDRACAATLYHAPCPIHGKVY